MADFTQYNLSQLKQLKARVAKEIDKRESEKKTVLLKQLRKLARKEGIELEELLDMAAKPTAPSKGAKTTKQSPSFAPQRAALPIKYRNPNNLSQGWSGRGRKPGWFEAWVNNGGSLDALENAAQSRARKKPVAAPSSAAAPATDKTEASTASHADTLTVE